MDQIIMILNMQTNKKWKKKNKEIIMQGLIPPTTYENRGKQIGREIRKMTKSSWIW